MDDSFFELLEHDAVNNYIHWWPIACKFDFLLSQLHYAQPITYNSITFCSFKLDVYFVRIKLTRLTWSTFFANQLTRWAWITSCTLTVVASIRRCRQTSAAILTLTILANLTTCHPSNVKWITSKVERNAVDHKTTDAAFQMSYYTILIYLLNVYSDEHLIANKIV